MNVLNTRIVLRNDSLSNWLLNQSMVLLRGEVGIEYSDNGDVKLKIGDGVTPWSGLSYFGGEIIGDQKSIELINKALQIAGFDTAEVGTYPVKGADGSITWVRSVNQDVEDLKVNVNDLRSIVGTDATADVPATGLFALLNKKANADEHYTKIEIDSMLSSVYKYRGSKASYAELPTEGQTIGDVWNIETDDLVHGIKAGDNVAWNGASWDRLAGTVDTSGFVKKEEFFPIKSAVEEMPLLYLTQKKAEAVYRPVRYEITDTPAGTLVDYREKEIRVMCQPDAEWRFQNVGATGNKNMYYMSFKAYAPNDSVVSFKEDMNEKITDNTMHYFENNSSAGIDKYGRKYSICWLALARYDEGTQKWVYFGENSNPKKCTGWTYTVEWYDANGVKVESDTIRINLTNESCHYITEPYYARNFVKNIKLNGTILDMLDGVVEINLPAIKTSTEENKVAITEDGTMEVNSLNVNKLVQNNNEYILLNGGNSSTI